MDKRWFQNSQSIFQRWPKNKPNWLQTLEQLCYIPNLLPWPSWGLWSIYLIIKTKAQLPSYLLEHSVYPIPAEIIYEFSRIVFECSNTQSKSWPNMGWSRSCFPESEQARSYWSMQTKRCIAIQEAFWIDWEWKVTK